MSTNRQDEKKPPAPGQPVLVIRDLGVRRQGRWLFRHLNCDIPAGAFIAVTGASGVGKSSFLNVLAGSLQPTEGEACYHFGPCMRAAEQGIKTHRGVVFQDLLLVPTATVLDNVMNGRLGRYSGMQTLTGMPRLEKDDALQALAKVGIVALAYQKAGEVSGGEQQRTAIARALFQEPDLFLLDEPVSNLDHENAHRILNTFQQLAHRDGRTILCVLHDKDLVQQYADYDLEIAAEPRLTPIPSAS